MDRQTSAIYKRGAVAVLPILAIVGCRVGLRACVAIDRSDRNHRSGSGESFEQGEARRAAQLAAANASATSEATAATDQPRSRNAPPKTPSQTPPIASGQQVPDALALDALHIAWLNTRSGEVVVVARTGSSTAPRIVANEQKLPQRRHLQGLALAGNYVYWITSTLPSAAEEDGSIMRAAIGADGGAPGQPEVVASGLGGLSALLVEKDSVYYARSRRLSRDKDGVATGGVYRIKLGPKQVPAKDAQLLLAAERPCALAADESGVYAVEQTKLWRIPKGKGEAKELVGDGERLGCTVAVDPDNVYWTVPTEDSVMRAKKNDGTEVGVVAFTRKRPTNVVVDKGYAYVLTETSQQALGELGSIYRVALRSERLTPQALVTDQVGLGSVAALGGFVVFSGYNEAETDGIVAAVPSADSSSDFKRGK